jgi:hypothetical protein
MTTGMGAEIRIANPEAIEAFNGTTLAGRIEAIAGGHFARPILLAPATSIEKVAGFSGA